ncbi:MAG: ribonuclease H-like domain-containing protein, partial [Methanosarcinales archaeon]|nr:ribonuclease H-like domain-containing protein [Methanosarcinales archaeon]
MTGFDAVRLWRHYERGDDDALKTLVAYNREDIENLKTIMHMVYEKVVDNEVGSV